MELLKNSTIDLPLKNEWPSEPELPFFALCGGLRTPYSPMGLQKNFREESSASFIGKSIQYP
jgi:hypothetical protein